MSYSIQDLKNDLQGVLHGTRLNQITNLDGVINRAARQLLLEIDPQETKREVEFVNPIFNTVFDYPIAADVKGNKLIDIFPQVQRLPRDTWLQDYNQAFDVEKQNIFSLKNMFTINFNTSIKTLRVNAPFLNPPVIITNADTLTGNDVWTGATFSIDYTNFADGAGALTFNLPAGSPTIITDTFVTPLNLAAEQQVSGVFFWVYMPTASAFTSIQMNMNVTYNGSYIGDWISPVITQTQEGTAFQNGWNLLTYNWSACTVSNPMVLVPPVSALLISGQTFTFNTNSTIQTGVKLNGVKSIVGTVLSYEYYSKFLFRDAITGAYQETVTDPSNLINLDTESFNLLFNLVAYYAIQQQQGLDATFYDGPFFKGAYDEGVIKYKSLYKSEIQKVQSVYYSMPRKGWGRFWGRGW